ncbi:MAG TPA: cytochrome c oxidase subunit 3 [bacterium]
MAMSSVSADKGDQGSAHVTPPSLWPFALAIALGFLALGLLMELWAGSWGTGLLVFSGLATVICLMGWANHMIGEMEHIPNVMQEDRGLRMGVLLFLASESAIFGALFAHHYYARFHAAQWPPQGAPKLATHLPAIATLILMFSSATMQWAHTALLRDKRRAASWLVLLTIVLGVVFLGFQGYDWGFLKVYDKFTQTSGTYGTSFYSMTGFHGLHVTVGLIFLMLVWIRLRLGHFDPKRHFSFIAATWYWHFVDLIWIFLFFTIYLF